MPKKLKLDLGGLKVQSFVTSLEARDESKIKGGNTGITCPEPCVSKPYVCPTDNTWCGTCNTCGATCDATCDTCFTCLNTCNPEVFTCDPACIL